MPVLIKILKRFFHIIRYSQALTNNADEGQLNELHVTAKPLIETCSPNIVQRINESVKLAETEWKDTNNNLRNLRDKYNRALNLWQKYRDGSDAIKNWAADRMGAINVLKPLDANAIEVIIQMNMTNWHVKISDND